MGIGGFMIFMGVLAIVSDVFAYFVFNLEWPATVLLIVAGVAGVVLLAFGSYLSKVAKRKSETI